MFEYNPKDQESEKETPHGTSLPSPPSVNGSLSAQTNGESAKRGKVGSGSEYEVSSDPFDPAALRLNPDTAAGAIGVKRKIVSVKVGKPDKMEFCRVHPSEEFRIDTAIVEDKTNCESYLVAPALRPELPDFITLVRLCVAVNRHGTTFLWPAKLPDPNGRPMDWHTSMLEAQQLATQSWVRVQADMSAGSYAVFEATGNLPEPEWTDLSLAELLKIAFKSHFIDTIDHPYLQELFGAA